MTEDKFRLLKQHVCSEGLNDELVREIADECELVRLEPGDYLHRASEIFECIFLLIHGRIKQSLLDFQGNIMVQRHHSAGAHFGALASALGEPAPIDLVAEEPSVLLRLDYQTSLRLTREHEDFRQNFSKMIADAVLDLIMKDRRQLKPALVAVFHQSAETRPLTRRLIARLKELGEKPHVITDQSDWQPIDDVPDFRLIKNGDYVPVEDVQQQVESWSNSKRTFFDIDAGIDRSRTFQLAEVAGKILWCVTLDNWRHAVARIEALLERAPGCAKKSISSGCCLGTVDLRQWHRH